MMEALNILEKKIASLIELIKELKTENAKLAEETAQLLAQLKGIEGTATSDAKQVDELNQEKTFTKLAVDELISSIDLLIESENQQ